MKVPRQFNGERIVFLTNGVVTMVIHMPKKKKKYIGGEGKEKKNQPVRTHTFHKKLKQNES